MTIKETAMRSIADLPESVSWEDIGERIRFLAAVEKGLEDIRQGRTVPHEEVKASVAQWLSE
jgi:predicted transcriptional regulator